MRLRRLLAVFIVLGTYACAQPGAPVPSQGGDPVATPEQCQEIIRRGGRC